MTDSLERFLQDLHFEVPTGLVDRAKAAAAANAADGHQAVRRTHARGVRRSFQGRDEFVRPGQQWALALVAALLAIAIVATLVGVRALHFSAPTPARHGQLVTPHHNGQIVFGDGNTLYAVDPVSGKRHSILAVETDPTCSAATTRIPGLSGLCVLVSDPAYSPDGGKLAYLRSAGFDFADGTIWILDTSTGRNELVTTCGAPGCGRFSHLTWSPDGSRLAFSDSDGHGGLQLYLIEIDGTHRTQLTHFPVGQNATQPSWSPDGTRILFTLSTGVYGQSLDCGYGCQTLAPPSNIDVINTDGSGLAVLLANVRQQDGVGNLDPTWSPDGSSIAYAVNIPLTGPLSAENELWIMNADGSHRTQIFSTEFCCDPGGPAWSPDGTQIAMVGFGMLCTGNPAEPSSTPPDCAMSARNLFVMKADGSKPRSLGRVGTGDRPTWQPVQ